MTTVPAHEDGRIVRDPRVMVGKPVVRGTRIPVELVLEQLESSTDLDELFGAYPDLTLDDVKACLRYARHAVHREWTHASVAGGATRASA